MLVSSLTSVPVVHGHILLVLHNFADTVARCHGDRVEAEAREANVY